MEQQKPSVYEREKRKRDEARAADQAFQAKMRARLQKTIETAEAIDAAQAKAKADADEQAFKAHELQRWLLAGGDASTFNADWPKLRQQLVKERYLQERSQAPTTLTVAQRHLNTLYGRSK